MTSKRAHHHDTQTMTDVMGMGGPSPAYQSPPPPYMVGPQGFPGPQAPGHHVANSHAVPIVYNAQPLLPVAAAGAQPGSMYRYHSTPAKIVCQHCNSVVTTSLTYENGVMTWAASGVMCLMGCWLGCCCIPFCIKAFKDVVHSCPNCGHSVGKFASFS